MEYCRSHGNRSTTVRGSISILLVTVFLLSKGFVDCRKIETGEHKNPVIKTIKGDGGDVIDCVDIYKQPALNHPLLKNHTIQLKPAGINETESVQDDELLQSWLLNGECPEGTIPILRTQAFDNSLPKNVPHFNGSEHYVIKSGAPGHEYAQVSMVNGGYYGAHAYLNVWSPLSVNRELTLAQIWVVGGEGEARSTVEAGWIMNLGKPRFFIFWTGHNYHDGCYNLACPGFVQVSRKFSLGYPIQPVSSYKGKQFEIFISIYKHQSAGQWWLKVQNEVLGYWPDSILPYLQGSANVVSWGGEIFNSEIGGRHTSTQMGSGHFPSEGFGKASYFRNIRYLASSGKFVDPQGLITYATKPSCYNVLIDPKVSSFGTHFYYGGPGYSARCPK